MAQLSPDQEPLLVLAQAQLARADAALRRLLDADGPDGTSGSASDPEAEALRELVPRWHFAMLNDLDRNSLFEEAIADTIRPGDHVLDIGSGSGLLAMLAARYGAGSVTSCEAVRPIARAAAGIVADNGLADLVTVVGKLSTDLIVGRDLPRLADVLITETFDCALVGEGALPSLRHARTALLRPGGRVVPRYARVLAVPVDSPTLSRFDSVGSACGFDVSGFNAFASRRYFPVLLGAWPHRMLSEPTEVLSFDFLSDPLEPGETAVEFTVERSGTCHGIAFWFELGLDDRNKRVLSNEPANRHGHWDQAFQCLTTPVPVDPGRSLRLRLTHTDDVIHFDPV
jgi:protein arginine N-methyltransferase 1